MATPYAVRTSSDTRFAYGGFGATHTGLRVAAWFKLPDPGASPWTRSDVMLFNIHDAAYYSSAKCYAVLGLDFAPGSGSSVNVKVKFNPYVSGAGSLVASYSTGTLNVTDAEAKGWIRVVIQIAKGASSMDVTAWLQFGAGGAMQGPLTCSMPASAAIAIDSGFTLANPETVMFGDWDNSYTNAVAGDWFHISVSDAGTTPSNAALNALAITNAGDTGALYDARFEWLSGAPVGTDQSGHSYVISGEGTQAQGSLAPIADAVAGQITIVANAAGATAAATVGQRAAITTAANAAGSVAAVVATTTQAGATIAAQAAGTAASVAVGQRTPVSAAAQAAGATCAAFAGQVTTAQPTLGAHGTTFKEYGSPAAVDSPAMSTQSAGSAIIVAIGRGGLGNLDGAVTDNKGNGTYTKLGASVVYTEYTNSGSAIYGKASLAGGSGHVVSQASLGMPDLDEVTLFAVEAKSGAVIHDYSSASIAATVSTLTSNPVTTTGPALLVAFCFPGGGTMPGTYVPTNGFSILDIQAPALVGVQGASAYKQVSAAGTYSVSFDIDVAQPGTVFLVAVQGSPATAVTANAAGAIAAATLGQRVAVTVATATGTTAAAATAGQSTPVSVSAAAAACVAAIVARQEHRTTVTASAGAASASIAAYQVSAVSVTASAAGATCAVAASPGLVGAVVNAAAGGATCATMAAQFSATAISATAGGATCTTVAGQSASVSAAAACAGATASANATQATQTTVSATCAPATLAAIAAVSGAVVTAQAAGASAALTTSQTHQAVIAAYCAGSRCAIAANSGGVFAHAVWLHAEIKADSNITGIIRA